ncbi:MAG: DUF4328 domain-containing protein [Saprospiraceae bacterium]|nr:DUF4328 domain-containing protein [Saprospiraceae bacterium]
MKHNLQRAKQIVLIFWILLGISILSLISELLQLNLLNRFSGGYYDDHSANVNDIRQGVIALLTFITIIFSIIFFIRWFRRAYYNLHKIGVKGLRYSEGWAAGCWFIPFINLMYPYQIMREIWIETQRAIAGNNNIKNANLVGWWWALYLFSNTYSYITLRISLNANDIEALIQVSVIGALGLFIEIPAILATIFMIQETAAFEQKLYTAGVGETDLLEHLVEN